MGLGCEIKVKTLSASLTTNVGGAKRALESFGIDRNLLGGEGSVNFIKSGTEAVELINIVSVREFLPECETNLINAWANEFAERKKDFPSSTDESELTIHIYFQA